MKKSFLGLMMAAILAFTSCEPNDLLAGKELSVNTYSVNGVVKQLNSVAMDIVGEYPFIVASPTPNLTTAEAILESEEYIFVAVSPLLVGKEFDLKTESSLYTITSTLGGAPLKEVTPEDNSEVQSGTAQLTYEGGVAVVKASITLTNGREFELHLSAEKQIVVNENTISRGDEKKPLRASFYMVDDTYTALYFTPALVEYFNEMVDNASWYLYIMVENRFLTGEKVDLSAESLYMFGVIDNADASRSVMIMGEDLQGATGNYSIAEKGEGGYNASLEITVNGVLYKAQFDGTCVPYDAEPEKKINYLIYNGVEYEVTSARMPSQDDSTYTFRFSTSLDKEILLKAPHSFFNGNACGFSQSDDFVVEFDGVTFSAANNSRGTITATYDASSSALVLDFTNYNNLQFNFNGEVDIRM